MAEDGEDPKVSRTVHFNRVVPGLHVADAHVIVIRVKPASVNHNGYVTLICGLNGKRTFRSVGS